MPDKPRIGLLPLYLELYDKSLPDMRKVLVPFLDQIAQRLGGKNVHVVKADVCRLETEVSQAIAEFEREGVDLIAILHLAYSPSLESAAPLEKTRIPLLFLDTTMDLAFGPEVDPERLLYNHGIHGVQDLASLLRRRGRSYAIAAGHWETSNVLDRAAGMAYAAQAARLFREAKVLRIGPPFTGMGDFAVADDIMKEKLGIVVVPAGTDLIASEAAAITDADVQEEMAKDANVYTLALDAQVHERSTRVGLALRRVLEKGAYSAFSMNFLMFDSPTPPVNTVPFLEASKAMARGIGYAGESDTLTAALVGALAKSFGDTTFAEVFCPDWIGDRLFFSHMGEVNPDLLVKPVRVIEKDFPWTPALTPAVAAGVLAPGSATLVNLAPGPNDTFRLLIAEGKMVTGAEHPGMRDAIRGWFAPKLPVAPFLEAYSREGGTHHSALMMSEWAEALDAFAKFAGLEPVRIC